jgi:hypothetical protein
VHLESAFFDHARNEPDEGLRGDGREVVSENVDKRLENQIRVLRGMVSRWPCL